MHIPPTQCSPEGHGPGLLPHLQLLLVPHESVVAVTQLKQVTPSVPQLVLEFARHMPPLQQPPGHVWALHPVAHGPPSQPQKPSVQV
jgi:hypothetical protein